MTTGRGSVEGEGERKGGGAVAGHAKMAVALSHVLSSSTTEQVCNLDLL